MKIIVTHTAPDWDAIGSVWILKKYLPGWNEADVRFVPAGQRFADSIGHNSNDPIDPIEILNNDEVIHVDTGLGPLDHHQTSDVTVSGAKLSWKYVLSRSRKGMIFIGKGSRGKHKHQAIDRIMNFIVETDHFREIYWPDPASHRYEFTILGILDGLKHMRPNDDNFLVETGFLILDSIEHQLENRIWAEEEMEKGIEFETRWGKGIGFETINDDVIKLAQKNGYQIAIRKDPRKGYVRIKARPYDKNFDKDKNKDVDLKPVYEKLMEEDNKATWFYHVSGKMLLNGTPKNPKMVPTVLSLAKIIEIIKNI